MGDAIMVIVNVNEEEDVYINASELNPELLVIKQIPEETIAVLPTTTFWVRSVRKHSILPRIPLLIVCVAMLPNLYVPQSLCSPVLCSPVSMFPGPMFPGIYAPQYLCSPVSMFPRPMFPSQYLCSPVGYLCFPVPMFPSTYVPQYLCPPIPKFPNFHNESLCDAESVISAILACFVVSP